MSESGTRVLIADDDEMVRLIARAVVERAGMEAIDAADGSEAMAFVSGTERLDLVLLDIDMPVIGGLDVLRAIRANPARSRTPVLILTGAEGEDLQSALALGATGVFPKPIAAEKLMSRIRELAR
jgi:two-component system chemotaxis response regulator CheY